MGAIGRTTAMDSQVGRTHTVQVYPDGDLSDPSVHRHLKVDYHGVYDFTLELDKPNVVSPSVMSWVISLPGLSGSVVLLKPMFGMVYPWLIVNLTQNGSPLVPLTNFLGECSVEYGFGAESRKWVGPVSLSADQQRVSASVS